MQQDLNIEKNEKGDGETKYIVRSSVGIKKCDDI